MHKQDLALNNPQGLIYIKNHLTHSRRHKRFHAFPNSISPKVNIIAQLECKLVYDNVTVQHVSHYATETPEMIKDKNYYYKCKKHGKYFFNYSF